MRSPRPLVRCVALLMTLTAPGGCETLEALSGNIEKPSAKIRGVRIERLAVDGATLGFDVEVRNPYSAALPLVGIDYALASGGAPFVTGTAPLSGSIAAGGSRVIQLPATVDFAQLLSAVAGVRPGAVVPYRVDLDLSVDAPRIGRLALPLHREASLPVPAPPKVSLERVRWTRLGLREAEAALRFQVVNQNEFPVALSHLDYALALAGRPVVQTGLAQAATFPAGGEQTFDVPVSFSPASLGLAFLDVLRGEGAAYDLDGRMQFDSAFGPLDLPFERSGMTPFVGR